MRETSKNVEMDNKISSELVLKIKFFDCEFKSEAVLRCIYFSKLSFDNFNFIVKISVKKS